MFRYTHPSGGLISLLSAERRRAFGVDVAGGKGPLRRVPEDGGFLAGCRLGGAFRAFWQWPWSYVCGVCCGMRRTRRVMSVLARRDWFKLKNLLKTSCESVDLRSCCLQSPGFRRRVKVVPLCAPQQLMRSFSMRRSRTWNEER